MVIIELRCLRVAELALTYQEKTDIEHILDAPDTYIGSIDRQCKKLGLDENDNIKHKEYDFIGGLYKCFDEGIVNCRDHYKINAKNYQ